MATIKCKCGNTYFARIQVNQFRDNPIDLYRSLHEVEPDTDIRIYQCILCKDYMLPPVNYFNSTEDDKELYNIIEKALEGKVVEKKPKFRTPIHPGSARFVGGEKDQENNGKIVPLH